MIRSILKFLLLFILLLPVAGLLNGCNGKGGGGGGTIYPAAPTGLMVTVSDNQVVLQWNAAANAATYRLYYAYFPD
jgi:hypothetical protein